MTYIELSADNIVLRSIYVGAVSAAYGPDTVSKRRGRVEQDA